ncbi:MAG: hypothetical protein WBO55_02975 [Rhizobiaceae bacterium]
MTPRYQESMIRPFLIIVTVIDFAIATLLVAVSGFVLEGVNGRGDHVGDILAFIAMIVICIAAPIAAWVLSSKLRPACTIILAASPIILGLLALMLEPLFV